MPSCLNLLHIPSSFIGIKMTFVLVFVIDLFVCIMMILVLSAASIRNYLLGQKFPSYVCIP